MGKAYVLRLLRILFVWGVLTSVGAFGASCVAVVPEDGVATASGDLPDVDVPLKLWEWSLEDARQMVIQQGGEAVCKVREGGEQGPTIAISINPEWMYVSVKTRFKGTTPLFDLQVVRRSRLKDLMAPDVPDDVARLVSAIHNVGGTEVLAFNPLRLIRAALCAQSLTDTQIVWAAREYFGICERHSRTMDPEEFDEYRALLLLRYIMVPTHQSASALPPIYGGDYIGELTSICRRNGCIHFPLLIQGDIPFLAWSPNNGPSAAGIAYVTYCDIYCRRREALLLPSDEVYLCALRAMASMPPLTGLDEHFAEDVDASLAVTLQLFRLAGEFQLADSVQRGHLHSAPVDGVDCIKLKLAELERRALIWDNNAQSWR